MISFDVAYRYFLVQLRKDMVQSVEDEKSARVKKHLDDMVTNVIEHDIVRLNMFVS
jgi:hypothetical protein